ncbi:EscD/YscD/HrpQ family type III secretion system inner membrane ring protein, partial [Vibrio parahaemolyticus]
FIADLVLSDAGVEANHFTLVCDSESVMLRGCQDVTINGENRAVGESSIELERHAVISIGVVKFALGYVEDELIVTNVTDAQTKQDAPVVTTQSTSWKRTALIAVLCSA